MCLAVCIDTFQLFCKLAILIVCLVEKVANESQKTPRDVVMMENFHHIFATLSRLKISCLEAEKKEAKQKYTDHLQSYVIYSLGQPLEKLNVKSPLFYCFTLEFSQIRRRHVMADKLYGR